MSETITPTKLRDNIYNILDLILETGIPITIVRNGKKLTISPEENQKKNKLDNLVKRDVYNCDPDDLISTDWSKYWTELENLND